MEREMERRRNAGMVPERRRRLARPRTTSTGISTSTSATDSQRPLAARSPLAIHNPDRHWAIPTRPPGTDCLSGILAPPGLRAVPPIEREQENME